MSKFANLDFSDLAAKGFGFHRVSDHEEPDLGIIHGEEIGSQEKNMKPLRNADVPGIADGEFIVEAVPSAKFIVLWKQRKIIDVHEIRDDLQLIPGNALSQSSSACWGQ